MRRISTYSQTTVTMMPKAPSQRELTGSAVAHALLDLSKSSTSEYAAMITTKTPMMTPHGMPNRKLGWL